MSVVATEWSPLPVQAPATCRLQPPPVLARSARWYTVAVAVALSGALNAWAAPTVGDQPLLAWIAFAPWLWAARALAPLPAAAWGLAMGLACLAPGRWTLMHVAMSATGMSGMAAQGATLLFFLAYALPFAVFGALDGPLRRWLDTGRSGSALLQAAVLASLICALSIWLAPFPYTPAVALADHTALLQLAALGGEPLLLTLLLWPSALLASGFAQSPRGWLGWVRMAAPLLLCVLLGYGWGRWRVASLDQAEARGTGLYMSTLVLQLDLPAHAAPVMWLRDRVGPARSALELSRSGLRQAPWCELVLWPETPLEGRTTDRVCAQAPRLANALQRPLLMQCADPAGAGQRRFTMRLHQPGGAAPAVHAKSSLVPLYEQPLTGPQSLLPGPPGTVFDFDARRRLAPALCYELHSRTHLRASVLGGAHFVVHQASYVPWQRQPIDLLHQRMARIRAVEFGRPIVSASNRAASGWIDAAGRQRSQSARFGSEARCATVWSPAGTPPPQVWIAPVAPYLPAGLAVLALLLSRRLRARAASAMPTTHPARSTP